MFDRFKKFYFPFFSLHCSIYFLFKFNFHPLGSVFYIILSRTLREGNYLEVKLLIGYSERHIMFKTFCSVIKLLSILCLHIWLCIFIFSNGEKKIGSGKREIFSLFFLSLGGIWTKILYQEFFFLYLYKILYKLHACT